MPKCSCGRSFTDKRYLTRHKSTCPVIASISAETRRKLAQQDTGREHKKRRVEGILGWATPFRAGATSHEQAGSSHAADGVFCAEHEDSTDLPALEDPITVSANPPPEEPKRTRAGRIIRPTAKVRDNLPEGPGDWDEDTHTEARAEVMPSVGSGVRRVLLLVTERIRTKMNKFGLSRFYKRRPAGPLDQTVDLSACYAPTANTTAAKKTSRTIPDIIFPYPNLSSWLFAHYYWRGDRKSLADRDELQRLLTRDDFKPTDIQGVNFRRLDEEVAQGDTPPWINEPEGWHESSITIGIPSGEKPTQASRRQTAAAQRRIDRHEPLEDVPAEHSIPGLHFTIPGLWHKSLCAEIKHTLETDTAARDFVFDPFYLEHTSASGDTERVYGELYNSSVWVEEDIRLQNSPREPGCDLPRAIAALMFWSDATQITQFSQKKVWPVYLYFGNQSKYVRGRPTARAAHHIAYIPTLPDSLQDFIRARTGKAATDPLLTHCRRELFQGVWYCILDDEFLHAYEHGIVVDCIDGVRRRIYPRIFVYSADYPEKVLVATIRDKGGCPCPRCCIKFDNIPMLGTASDMEARTAFARVDGQTRAATVEKARELIYHDGYVVNSERVDELLKPESLVPTRNAFSARLQMFKFDVFQMLPVDILHEFELGVWKALFAHLIRILEAVGNDTIHVLNERFRQVAPFGHSTIRKFAADVSGMSRIAARDYEDILQCAIPCFEGLVPSPHNETVLSLLYIMAYWHGIAKMRMHTDFSLKLLDDATVVLGRQLRYFANFTCPLFDTKETDAEYATRCRTEARRKTTAQTLKAPQASQSSSGRRRRRFHLRTVKLHMLGDYAQNIKRLGTTDSYTTQIGEHEHRRVKARRRRTNHVRPDAQIAYMDTREAEMHRMAHELHEHGVEHIPGVYSHSSNRAPSTMNPEDHHHIADEQKNFISLREWQEEHFRDPAVKNFVPDLKAHIRLRLQEKHPQLSNQDIPIILKDDRIFMHAKLQVNYTTYDLQRDQDIVSPGFQKAGILVHMPEHQDSPYPWSYALILGVYHARVVVLPTAEIERVEFLWVRWLESDATWSYGVNLRRLERVQFVSSENDNAFGFVDPAAVIRGCHLIPAFTHGRTCTLLSPSLARDAEGDWCYYYINRFVDRDMLVRFVGCGIGHLELKAYQREVLEVPTAEEVIRNTFIMSGETEDLDLPEGADENELEDIQEQPDDLFAEL